MQALKIQKTPHPNGEVERSGLAEWRNSATAKLFPLNFPKATELSFITKLIFNPTLSQSAGVIC